VLILGLSGSFNTVEELLVPGLPRGFFHDSAAVLVEDGRVVCAVEEERITRVKHTHTFPLNAAERCAAQYGVRLSEIDEVAFFFGENFLDDRMADFALGAPDMPITGARRRIHELLGEQLAPERIHFVQHHSAHAASTYYDSGFQQALVLVMDGSGEEDSVSVYQAGQGGMELIRNISESKSLGQFYFHATRFLGFQLFDEYKVMGLASYGDASTFRGTFRKLYDLGPDGSYSFDYRRMDQTLRSEGIAPRRRGQGITSEHCDFAAALQETLEVIVTHMVGAVAKETGERNLCLAGGVAQNCTLNGRLAASGLFDAIFVHPASHDAGAALGAAVHRAAEVAPVKSRRRRTMSLGTPIGSAEEIQSLLDTWAGHVRYERCADIAGEAARLIADGAVIGWAQGRAEFGPRALGQRSILADPRPEENKTRINAIVKKRESFRPFAPAVLAEHAAEYFDLPNTAIDSEFMTFAVRVRESHRPTLAAVTHVDGTARVQVVHREDNELFWDLIRAFADESGVPVVLNTSFNNDAEPIVDSAADAVRCLLTTALDALAIGPFLVRKVADEPSGHRLVPVLLPTSAIRVMPETSGAVRYEVYERAQPFDGRRTVRIAAQAFAALTASEGFPSTEITPPGVDLELVEPELRKLWESRLIDLVPTRAADRPAEGS
jgi:predicted NodU family carbamoyl transferase